MNELKEAISIMYNILLWFHPLLIHITYTHPSTHPATEQHCVLLYALAGSQGRQGEVHLPQQSSTREITYAKNGFSATYRTALHIVRQHAKNGYCSILASADWARYLVFIKSSV
jgi:hypothetical protein